MNIDYVLVKKFDGKQWSIIESDYDTLVWNDESPKPTLAELEALIPIVEAEIVAEQEARANAIAERQEQREALLARLGITEEEAQLLLG
jgi:hypothetical protein